MGQIGALTSLINGTIADGPTVSTNFDTIKNTYNAHDVATTGVHGLGADTFAKTSDITAFDAKMVPIGCMIPFYDYNGALSFNTTYYAYCNGQTKVVGSIGSQVLPDLSGRYLVGFGTEGGANNNSVSWSIIPVGNASHQINLSAVGASHTHTYYYGYDHTHSFSEISGYASQGGAGGQHYQHEGDQTDYHRHSVSGTSYGSSIGTVTTDTVAAGTGGSATQSIQPSSIACRMIMRIL